MLISMIFGLPVIGAIVGVRAAASGWDRFELYFVGILLGFVIAMWITLAYLIFKMFTKSKRNKQDKKSETIPDKTSEVPDSDEVI